MPVICKPHKQKVFAAQVVTLTTTITNNKSAKKDLLVTSPVNVCEINFSGTKMKRVI